MLFRSKGNLFHLDGGNIHTYRRMIHHMDEGIGRVMATLEQHGIADDTLIIFTSDNGGERFSKTWPFTGQKTELLEGGLRVPTLLRWPARIRPQVQAQVSITMDWLPTLLEAAGVAPHPDYPSDGLSILPVLLGEAKPFPRTLYWRYKANAQRAVREGDWKYLKINENEFLFDVAVDTLERANLGRQHPAVFERLKADWARWDAGMLPITAEVYSHGVAPEVQADRYRPESQAPTGV